MAKQTIDIGSQPNDGTGDSLRQGAQKINSNFNEIYQSFGDGFNLSQLTIGTATTAGFAQTAGIATNAQNLNGQPASFYLNYNNLNNLPTIPTNTNQLTNGAGYITTTALVGYATDGDLVGFQTAGNLVGFITNIQAGAGISVFESPAGNFIVTSTGGLVEIIGDVTPQLGGDLDLNNNSITGTGNIDYTGNLELSGNVDITGINTINGTSNFNSQITYFNSPSVNSPANFRIEPGEAGLGVTLRSSGSLELKTNGSALSVNIGSQLGLGVGGGGVSQYVWLYGGSTKRLETTNTGVEVTGNLTATKFIGDGSSLSGIATDVGLAGVEASVNALGTNLNIVGFYDATLGVVTSLTLVGQSRGIAIGSTLPSAGINNW